LRLLLDTNIVILAALQDGRMPSRFMSLLGDSETDPFVSSIALWEIGIKYRQGKLDLSMSPAELLDLLPLWRIRVLQLTGSYAIHDPDLPKDLKDPFDRMFVAIAERERMTFLTTDAKLLDHPLAWRP